MDHSRTLGVTGGGDEVKQPCIKENGFKEGPVGEMQRAMVNALGCCPGSRASPGRNRGATDA